MITTILVECLTLSDVWSLAPVEFRCSSFSLDAVLVDLLDVWCDHCWLISCPGTSASPGCRSLSLFVGLGSGFVLVPLGLV